MDITWTLNPNEQQVLTQILDAAVKQLGLSGVVAIAHFNQKLTNAQEAAKIHQALTPPPQPKLNGSTEPAQSPLNA